MKTNDVPRTCPLPLDTIMRLNHERDCHDEPPFDRISINHRHVHESDALRERGVAQRDAEPPDAAILELTDEWIAMARAGTGSINRAGIVEAWEHYRRELSELLRVTPVKP